MSDTNRTSFTRREVTGVANCEGCKFRNPLLRKCLLGRSPENCVSREARRGDSEFFDRILTLTPDQLLEQRRRAEEHRRQELKSKARLGVIRNSDWTE